MTATDTPGTKEVGTARRRKEDARLVTGETRWTSNITMPGMLHAGILRSPMAHAEITSVDLSAALEQPGVVAAYSGADLADDYGDLPCAWPVTPDMKDPGHKPLAVDRVRFVGDGVAIVLAESETAAIDALDHVDVQYERLDAVVDMEEALEEGAPLVHEAAGTNETFVWPLQTGDQSVFDDADVVVSRRFVQQRLVPNAMEPCAVVVSPLPGTGEYTIYSATQVPHILRTMAAMVTETPEAKIRVVAPDVGGGFGSKLQVTAEEILLLALAKRLGRPVKWVQTRSEAFKVTHHGRDQIQDITIAADADGTFRGMRAHIYADMGAYLMLVTPGVPVLGGFMYSGIYKFDGYDFRCTGVFTNKTPTDAYRGAGRPEATFALERIVDELADELGRDPMDLRRQNWIKHEEFPYDTIAGLTYDTGNYEDATDRAMELFDYDGLREEQQRRREDDDRLQLGIGISTYTEMCGLAPSRVLGQLDYGAGGWEAATVRMLPTGKVQVVTGTSPHGQGHVTSWSQIAADALGVPFEDVEVLHGDTHVSPQGLDTYGSRSLTVGGIAVLKASEKVISKAKPLAAHMLEASEDDIEFSDGRFHVKGDPEASATIQDLALAVFAAHDLPDGMEPDLTGHTVFDPENFSFPHGTHLCAVEVDTETGRPSIRRYVAVDDVGNVINPQIVEGQVHGGLAQGIAQALYEEAIHDERGNLTTSSIVDYYVPGAPDLPSYTTDRTETPATSNPLGVKGVGEAGTIASTPAVVNAIVDAVRHLGVNDVRMACTPERIWQAIQNASTDGGDT
ncbi:MAG: xanthine dehydrogenase family protein molybdopterin-binding subunit [Nitriliruptorales bacterium]|nr:xanthine dehydrogenase family protein molybdopterin-binding subunit [Nitriliruptorales bacterium]